ncbi:unnamed protein product [Paramecium pentaurelia]|uniref:Uncharacterized protein n=1 Tax=Paramecium pentaurelia TaxID=43138 RepID=A0A8S1S1H5_9CILI|nr:unnamed protein product [Paramecium pentaurelia]
MKRNEQCLIQKMSRLKKNGININNVIFLLIKNFFDQRDYYLAIVPITYSVEQVKSFIIDGIDIRTRSKILFLTLVLSQNDYHMESNQERVKYYYFIKQQFDYKQNRIILLFLEHQHQNLEGIIGELRLKSMQRRKKSLQEQQEK